MTMFMPRSQEKTVQRQHDLGRKELYEDDVMDMVIETQPAAWLAGIVGTCNMQS